MTGVSNYDTSKSLEQLENNFWPDESKYLTGLVEKCHLFRKKSVSSLTIEELRLLIGQNIGLTYLIPIALNTLEQNPFVEGDFYPGDLLNSVLKSDINYWKENAASRNIMLSIIDKSQTQMALFPNVRRTISNTISKFKISI